MILRFQPHDDPRASTAYLARAITLACTLLFLSAIPARAQLRPLEPASWRVFDGGTSTAGEIGASRLESQRASLAGTDGDLWEAAIFSVAWRSGRFALEGAGTGQRFFRERERFAPLYPGVHPDPDGRRHDSGDYRISTIVRLTPDRSRTAALLRFGTRLPTTNNNIGLDRDAMDFFATVAGRTSRRPFVLGVEAGLGIHTTRNFEQDDLLLYSARAEYMGAAIVPYIVFVGQLHGLTHTEIRGAEDLGEARLGVRLGGRRWVRVEIVVGYETFSPSHGLIVAFGMAR